MATENSGVGGGATPAVSSGVSRSSNASADSYIGSLISLTSKSEIRYEGVLYNINTDESSIGLKNVRSFGTEGRKKDGPQIPPSDKVYEYILFRGSDIKDLQVKSSPPAQPPNPPINNDPAIIQQSHYPRPVTAPSSLPAMGGVASLSDIGSHSSQVGLAGSNYQGNLPLYPPGGALGTWGTSPPPNTSGAGMAMPMFWQGYYGPPNGLQHLHQQPLLRPPPGLPMNATMPQTMQYPNFNATLPSGGSNISIPMMPTSLPDVPPPLLPPTSAPLNLASFSSSSLSFPSSLAASTPNPIPTPTSAESLTGTLPNKVSNLPGLLPNSQINLPTSLPMPSAFTTPNDLGSSASSVTSKPIAPSGANLPFQAPGFIPSVPLTSDISNQQLLTPGQLLQSSTAASSSAQQNIQTEHKDVEVVKVSSLSQPEPSAVASTESRPPILPLPTTRPVIKPNGGQSQYRYNNRGRERGRGAGSSNERAQFTEDFDFEAMNEKFNKDEVWGHLGKSFRTNSNDDDYPQDDYDDEVSKISTEHVYNKDDFFDNLSCNTLDRSAQNGRTKFSEQMKLDTETFGEFSRNWRGRGPARGGRHRGGMYGRGGYNYGYGYNGRGRGRGPHARSF